MLVLVVVYVANTRGVAVVGGDVALVKGAMRSLAVLPMFESHRFCSNS